MAAHDNAAARAFPGPDYREVLSWIHSILKPATYVEIGVHSGGSLALIRRGTLTVGIDPEPAGGSVCPPGVQLYRLTSGRFFREHDLSRILGGQPVAFALIDGLHLFEQALDDLYNLERYMARDGVIAVHDTIPLDRETSSRERTTEFYTGDVWKIIPFLSRYRPELEIVTVLTFPSGLTLVRGFDPNYAHNRLSGQVFEFRELDHDYFEQYRKDFLRTIPNQRAAIEDFCQNTPVQSICSSGAVIPSRRR